MSESTSDHCPRFHDLAPRCHVPVSGFSGKQIARLIGALLVAAHPVGTHEGRPYETQDAWL